MIKFLIRNWIRVHTSMMLQKYSKKNHHLKLIKKLINQLINKNQNFILKEFDIHLTIFNMMKEGGGCE